MSHIDSIAGSGEEGPREAPVGRALHRDSGAIGSGGQSHLLPDGGDQPPSDTDDGRESEPEIVWRVSANRVGRLFATSGELYVTEEDLVFSPYPSGFGSVKDIGIPLEGIRTVGVIEPWERGVFDGIVRGGFRSRLRIELKSDEEEVFIFDEIDTAIEYISDIADI